MRKQELTKAASRNNTESRRAAPETDGMPARSELRAALKHALSVLKRTARYKMEPFLARRMHELGERKEFLDPSEHRELMRLVAFWRKRTLDVWEARLALREFNRLIPGMDKTR